ncbi:MAG: hypothetical protein HYS14_07915 [Candidatus Rokubacteria bacterium]|nr:hypothetical protein [Candidatus Rokubacteria bacterium]
MMDETAHLFVGEGLVKLELTPNATEFIEVRPFPFQDVLQMVLSGEIVDSMTIIAVLLESRRRSLSSK